MATKQSDYKRLNYASLHVKANTLQRFNLAKAQYAACGEKATTTQDTLLNYLLDRFLGAPCTHDKSPSEQATH